MLTRRTFLGTLACSVLVARPVAAAKMAKIGFLHFDSAGPSPEIDAFRQGLRELGYIEGQNMTLELRFAGGRVDALPELAADLVAQKVDVLVTPSTQLSLAAKKATSTIPIVFATVADPVGAGLVANFAHPGGNITGLASISAEISGKRLELLKIVTPQTSRVAVLYNPADRSNVLVLKQLQDAAPALSLTLLPVEVRVPDDFEGAFATMGRERAHGLFGSAGVLTQEYRKTLVALAAKARIPTIWGHRQFVDAGGLMCYAVNFFEQLRRAAVYVDKILKGTKPGDLPVEQPTQFELVINLKAAREIGLTIPQSLLLRADQVLE